MTHEQLQKENAGLRAQVQQQRVEIAQLRARLDQHTPPPRPVRLCFRCGRPVAAGEAFVGIEGETRTSFVHRACTLRGEQR